MKKPFLCLIFLLPLLTYGQSSISLETPKNGWKNSALLDTKAEHTVAAYPKPPVDRGGQKNRALIAGHLNALPKGGAGRYVVNGVSMPLYTDAQGYFVKPWSFGAGSNSVEIKHPNQTKKQVQFLEANTNQTKSRLRIVLSWDDPAAEVDLHLLTPSGEHAFWASPLLKQGGGLDVDSVDGGGPEIFSTATPILGTYLVYVNYWGNFTQAGYNFDPDAHEKPVIAARVSFIWNENTVDERQETMTVPLRRIGDLSFVRSFLWTEK